MNIQRKTNPLTAFSQHCLNIKTVDSRQEAQCQAEMEKPPEQKKNSRSFNVAIRYKYPQSQYSRN